MFRIIFSKHILAQVLIKQQQFSGVHLYKMHMFHRYDLECTDNGSSEEKSAEDGTSSATNSPTHASSHTIRPYATRSVALGVLRCGDTWGLEFSWFPWNVRWAPASCLCMFNGLVFKGGEEEHTPTYTRALQHTNTHRGQTVCIRISRIPGLKVTVRYVCVMCQGFSTCMKSLHVQTRQSAL